MDLQKGNTALHFAILHTPSQHLVEIVQLLLDLDCDVSARGVMSLTARDIACLTRKRDVVKLIDKHIVRLIRNSKMDLLERYLLNGYDHLFVQYDVMNARIIAAGNESSETLQFIGFAEQLVVSNIDNLLYYN